MKGDDGEIVDTNYCTAVTVIAINQWHFSEEDTTTVLVTYAEILNMLCYYP